MLFVKSSLQSPNRASEHFPATLNLVFLSFISLLLDQAYRQVLSASRIGGY
jgi:hypothetical protein